MKHFLKIIFQTKYVVMETMGYQLALTLNWHKGAENRLLTIFLNCLIFLISAGYLNHGRQLVRIDFTLSTSRGILVSRITFLYFSGQECYSYYRTKIRVFSCSYFSYQT